VRVSPDPGHLRHVDVGADLLRLLARDPSLFPASPDAGAWLGWVDGPVRAAAHLARIRPLADELRREGVTDVVLCGMGGSSLFPEVLVRTLGPVPGSAAGAVRLHVIDSTDPAAVLRLERAVPWSTALLVAASKSGTTVETLAHLARFRARLGEAHGAGAGRRIVAVTDPGSPLERLAGEEGFRAAVTGDPDVGGRYSALSPFGLLPAVLLGADVDGLVGAAAGMRDRALADPSDPDGPAGLAAFLVAAIADGRDVLHVLAGPGAGPFGAWIEQLVAESTGKRGRGLLPVVTRAPGDVRRDERRVVVALGRPDGTAEQTELDALAAAVPVLVLPEPVGAQLAAEAMRWMLATALLCVRLGVDPFDQPDVAAAKAATAAALAAGQGPGPTVPFAKVRDEVPGAHHLGVLAYVDPGGRLADELVARCRILGRELDVPVTFGIGPRYLHSTGQLHKGGPAGGVYAVVVGDDPEDADVPGALYGFSALKHAQAAGDLAALRAAGRRAHHVDAGTLTA